MFFAVLLVQEAAARKAREQAVAQSVRVRGGRVLRDDGEAVGERRRHCVADLCLAWWGSTDGHGPIAANNRRPSTPMERLADCRT